jgi:hypothetical protein
MDSKLLYIPRNSQSGQNKRYSSSNSLPKVAASYSALTSISPSSKIKVKLGRSGDSIGTDSSKLSWPQALNPVAHSSIANGAIESGGPLSAGLEGRVLAVRLLSRSALEGSEFKNNTRGRVPFGVGLASLDLRDRRAFFTFYADVHALSHEGIRANIRCLLKTEFLCFELNCELYLPLSPHSFRLTKI